MPGYFERVYPVERIAGGMATTTANYNAGGVTPHALTTRWTYTAPSATAAQIESLLAVVQRNVVATGLGAVSAQIQAVGVAVIYVPELNNTVGTITFQVLGHCGFLRPGEVLQGQTLDLGTGGAHDFILTAHLREFSV